MWIDIAVGILVWGSQDELAPAAEGESGMTGKQFNW